MSKTKHIHVVPHPSGWAGKRPGSSRASFVEPTQKGAFERARGIAKREGLETVIHRPNGQIRDKHSYGNDPFPPRG